MYGENETDIRSRQNVKDNGEVFTPFVIVDQMIDLIPDSVWSDPKFCFLEPTCGNGQFLVRIFDRRIKAGVNIIDTLNTMVGMDISQENILEAHFRLYERVCSEMRVQGIKPLSKDWNNLAAMAIAIVRNNIFKVKDSIDYMKTKLEKKNFFANDPTGNGQILPFSKQQEIISEIRNVMQEAFGKKAKTMTLEPFFTKA